MVAQFSSRLRDNQTLLGLHVWGNAAALDSHGYVVPVGGGYADRALAHAQGARGGGGGGAANAHAGAPVHAAVDRRQSC